MSKGEYDMRKIKEIQDYEQEAMNRVWYMRSRPCNIPEIEEGRLKALEKVEKEYPEVLDGFDEWECGYWNGILGAMRWVMGEDKDMLDT